MKRGLKGAKDKLILIHQPRGCKDYPDEKGTERRAGPFPDRNRPGCKDYPDEKGTERLPNVIGGQLNPVDARITPMKRGLKGTGMPWPPETNGWDARITPMKRGLKGRRVIVGREAIQMQGLPR